MSTSQHRAPSAVYTHILRTASRNVNAGYSAKLFTSPMLQRDSEQHLLHATLPTDSERLKRTTISSAVPNYPWTPDEWARLPVPRATGTAWLYFVKVFLLIGKLTASHVQGRPDGQPQTSFSSTTCTIHQDTHFNSKRFHPCLTYLLPYTKSYQEFNSLVNS